MCLNDANTSCLLHFVLGRLKVLSEQQQKLEADEDIDVWKAHLEKKLQLEREQESRIQQNVQLRQASASVLSCVTVNNASY